MRAKVAGWPSLTWPQAEPARTACSSAALPVACSSAALPVACGSVALRLCGTHCLWPAALPPCLWPAALPPCLWPAALSYCGSVALTACGLWLAQPAALLPYLWPVARKACGLWPLAAPTHTGKEKPELAGIAYVGYSCHTQAPVSQQIRGRGRPGVRQATNYKLGLIVIQVIRLIDLLLAFASQK